MDSANELRNAIKNIDYYADKIIELSKIQTNKDNDIGLLFGVNIITATKRFDMLAVIRTDADWIKIYTEGIESCIKGAEVCDKSFAGNKEELITEIEENNETEETR